MFWKHHSKEGRPLFCINAVWNISGERYSCDWLRSSKSSSSCGLSFVLDHKPPVRLYTHHADKCDISHLLHANTTDGFPLVPLQEFPTNWLDSYC